VSDKIRILIVDDEILFRKALMTLLSTETDLQVVGDAQNGEEAISMAVKLQPEVILMDLRMPVMDGVTATQRIHSSLPRSNVIILTTFDNDQAVFEGLKAGALGYLLKDASIGDLSRAIHLAAKGEYFLMPSITAKVVAEFTRKAKPFATEAEKTFEPLSKRESEILDLVATGISNLEIAQKLVISEGTVKNHLSKILYKLGVKDRLQAVLKAKQIGLV
jgi:DNA-binding NarL/FixJ family response regulator